MVLMNHGIFSFGATARESYERMIGLITRAEDYLKAQGAWEIGRPEDGWADGKLREEIAELRREVSRAAKSPMIMATFSEPQYVSFARRPDAAAIATRGPATPDHSIRTKRIPLIGRDVNAYVEAYTGYFKRNAAQAKAPKTMLDPAPRVILDPAFGLGCVGRTVKDARINRDIYAHTIDIILRAEALGGWQALPERDVFDVEYWDLEQAKLAKSGALPVFAGEVALVTGAASGIGKACVLSLLRRGAAVIALDVNEQVTTAFPRRPDVLGLKCDVSSATEVEAALECGVRAFGGLDMLVLNAGIFPGGTPIAALATEQWQKVMRINVDANLALMRECHPLLKRSPNGGRVAIVGSKNVPAPGPGAAAYSASKAALTQLARVAALEWGADRIRVNIVHPNAVFDTGIWTEQVLAERAKHYGMSVSEYKANNVLKAEVTSTDVAELVAEMCGPLFAKTTGAQVPVDGGNDRVI